MLQYLTQTKMMVSPQTDSKQVVAIESIDMITIAFAAISLAPLNLSADLMAQARRPFRQSF